MKASSLALAACALGLAACDAAAPPADAPAANAATAAADAAQPAANGGAAQGEFPALTGRVVDGAQILSADQEARLTRELAELEARTTDQLVIVTVGDLSGRRIEDFGLGLGRHWGIGQRGKDNGMLLIVAPAESRARIEVGYGLESILTDERARQIIDREILPHFREGRWNEGIYAGARTIAATLIEQERAPRQGPQ